MARNSVDSSAREQPIADILIRGTPQRETITLPLGAHPLWRLRRLNIILAIIGAILYCCMFNPYTASITTAYAVVLAISAILCLLDLLCYAARKAKHPDEEPAWPKKKWMVGDLLFAVVLLFISCSTIGQASTTYWMGPGLAVLAAYAGLAALICCVLHSRAFWKQLMARRRQSWLANLPRDPCACCGRSAGVDQQSEEQHQGSTQERSDQTRAASSSETSTGYRNVNIMTPESTEAAMEEGLLIGSDFETGYGSIQAVEPRIEQPGEIIVGNQKKNKKGNGKKVVKGKGVLPRGE